MKSGSTRREGLAVGDLPVRVLHVRRILSLVLVAALGHAADAGASSEGLDGMRTYIYRLVARAEGSYEIPAVEMSYFDAESESYGTSRGQPFVITVVPAGNGVR